MLGDRACVQAGQILRKARRHELVQGPRWPARYQGRITREPFSDGPPRRKGPRRSGGWPPDFASACSACTCAARRRPWRALHEASCARSVTAAIAGEAPRYMQVVGQARVFGRAASPNIALHRLVLVPRAMIAGHARVALFKRLGEVPELAVLDESVRPSSSIDRDRWMRRFKRRPCSMRSRRRRTMNGWRRHQQGRGVGGIALARPDGVRHVFMYEFPRAAFAQDSKAIRDRFARWPRRHVAQQDSKVRDGPHGVREMKGLSDPSQTCQNDASFGVGRPCPWARLPRRLRGTRLAASAATRHLCVGLTVRSNRVKRCASCGRRLRSQQPVVASANSGP